MSTGAPQSVVVVGAGMIGSSAARHLRAAGCDVTVVGGPEPEVYETHDGPWASHWDQARVTRVIDPHPLKALAALRTIERLPALEQASGEKLHHPVGLVYSSPSVEQAAQHSIDLGQHIDWLDADECRTRHGITLDGRDPIAWEGAPAGHIDPLAMVRAELAVGRADGVRLVEGRAIGLTRSGSQWSVETTAGVFEADAVLLATGPHGASFAGVELAITRALRTRLMLEFEAPMSVPSLIVDDVGHPDVTGIYWTPPVRYPDGRVMLKIGADERQTRFADGDADLDAWFRAGGHPDEARHLREVIDVLLPGVPVRSTFHQPCVTTWTDNGVPYIGPIDDGLVVAVGGNGGAAKSCDEWGRLAAEVIRTGSTNDPDFTDEALTPRLGDSAPREKGRY